MKAIIYTSYGGPEVLHMAEVPKPTPSANEVLIKVYAVSMNDWDWGLIQPDTFNRLMSGWRRPRRTIAGSDVAGKIEAVGSNVTRFKVGDDVYGDLSGRWGGFAEYVCAPENSLALKPARMSFEEAAAIPQAGMLAAQGLIDKGKIRSGQKVLINGAGGGVGTLGIQMAKVHNVEVTVVDRGDKLDMLRSLGADHAIDYTKEDFTMNGKEYDLILDAKTNRPVSHYLRALKPRGIYATVGGELRKLLMIFLSMPLIPLFTNKRITIVALKANKDLPYMNELYESGKLKPVIDPRRFTLEEVPEMFGYFGRADHKGKVVVTIGK